MATSLSASPTPRHAPATASRRSTLLVALGALALFLLPVLLFLRRTRLDAPFYFFAEDAFYYLSIALHSSHTPFFSIDGLHPTNGFHPLWEILEFNLARLPYFRLGGPAILLRLFTVDLAIVALAVSLLAAYIYRLTRRPWLSILAVCPGLLWLVAGIGAPAYLNFWASVNGMETGLELLFLAAALMLFGPTLRPGPSLLLAAFALGGMVLSRLDDVFFLLAFCIVAAIHPPASQRPRRLAPFATPLLMIGAYLLYNHHTVGVWMPVSGAAKLGLGLGANLHECLRLLTGRALFNLPPEALAFSFGNLYVMAAQMLAPVAIALGFLLYTLRAGTARPSPILQSLALGVLLKGAYNFCCVAIGYQGAWYYGASTATADILLAVLAAELLRRWSLAAPAQPPARPSPLASIAALVIPFLSIACLALLSFNLIASRASLNGSAPARDTWRERDRLAQALRASTHAPFLEFQDGELSFETGLPAISGFGLAADPEAVRAQRSGTYFDLLARRGVTVAAASNTYPALLAASAQNKAIFPLWGFSPREIQNICFQPFWTDPNGNIVLYKIRHQPLCPQTTPTP